MWYYEGQANGPVVIRKSTLVMLYNRGAANQLETKSHVSYCVTARSHIIHLGTNEHHSRTVARKVSIGGFAFEQGDLTFWNVTKTSLIYSVSCFNFGELGALFVGAKPTKTLLQHPISSSLKHILYLCSDIFIVNNTHQHDNGRTLQAIYYYACCLVGLLVIA